MAVPAVGGVDVEFDATFVAHYARIARVIARVVGDRSRAEELAVDVFLKWSRHPEARGEAAVGWLCRVGVRTGLDELRREARYRRFERLTRVLFVALPVTRAFGARCVEACVDLTARMTQFFRADEPGATAPKVVGATIGSIAADFVGTDVRGARLSLSSHRGRVVVLNFWATWCNPCRDEMPILSDLQNRFGARGLEVIGVSLDEDGWRAVTPFVTELGVTYPIVLGSDEVTAAYGGVPALPATFVIDREGLIIVKRVGPVLSGSLDEVIARLLAK